MMSPEAIVNQMLSDDAFSALLGMHVEQVSPGSAVVSLRIEPSMVNGFQIAHGAIAYALADSAMAFASNAFGKKSFSVETSISHVKKGALADFLTARCSLLHAGNKSAIYGVEVKNQREELIAHFKGTVYVSDEAWELNP